LAGIRNTPAWCYYDNDTENGKKYGKLYNWYAVNDPRGLAPEGYHIPNDNEWKAIENLLGKEPGKKLKSKNGWEHPGNGTDLIGFNALPGGYRDDYNFIDITYSALFWCATEYNNFAWSRWLTSTAGLVYRANSFDKSVGASVRIIRD
jgi:uncharacterized protein (TIGR02145 family)